MKADKVNSLYYHNIFVNKTRDKPKTLSY